MQDTHSIVYLFLQQNRRSWIEDPRLTQSQNLGSESGGNDSDNSLEEPSSLSETRPLNRHSNFRQSLQRKPGDLKHLETSLVRGGPVRSSLHTLPSNTSTPARKTDKVTSGAAQPQVKEKLTTTNDVASVVNLGGAGSRRTVYLDENQIKADAINRSPSNSINVGQPVSGSSSSTAGVAAVAAPATTNGGGSSGTSTAAPTTLLMYNRISNVISPLSSGEGGDNQGQQGSGSVSSQNSTTNNNNNKGSGLEDKDKESAIWYEYGCV